MIVRWLDRPATCIDQRHVVCVSQSCLRSNSCRSSVCRCGPAAAFQQSNSNIDEIRRVWGVRWEKVSAAAATPTLATPHSSGTISRRDRISRNHTLPSVDRISLNSSLALHVGIIRRLLPRLSNHCWFQHLSLSRNIATYSRFLSLVCCVCVLFILLTADISARLRQPVYSTTLSAAVAMSSLPTEQGKKAIEANRAILSADEQRTVDLLLDNDQAHLFAHWPAAGQQDEDKHRFLKQCALIESAYLGGIKTYVSRAKQLLAFAQQGGNPYEGQPAHNPRLLTAHNS